MPTTYEPADKQTAGLIAQVRKEHHPDLEGAGVTVSALFAQKFDKDGDELPALKKAGYPVAAMIQVTSLADRARGLRDAKLTICHYAWERLPEASRLALIDHELTHLQIVFDKDGALDHDDLGRPKLKTRPHDYELTGFVEVAQRHGEAAVEVRALKAFRQEQLPLFWPNGAGAFAG
jgi:hypothetical protein